MRGIFHKEWSQIRTVCRDPPRAREKGIAGPLPNAGEWC